MIRDFETLNKQIATFIIISSAFAVPVYADGGMTVGGGMLVPSAQPISMPIDRYAGPGIDFPVQPISMPIDRYAGPGIDFPVQPIDMPIDRYAGPGMPVVVNPNEPMVVKYAGPGINGEWPEPSTSEISSVTKQMKQINDSEKLRIINSADSVTVNTSEDEHVYGEIKVAPGHFRFW